MKICLTKVTKAIFTGSSKKFIRIKFFDNSKVKIRTDTLNIKWVESKIEALILQNESEKLIAFALCKSFSHNQGALSANGPFCAFVPGKKEIFIQNFSGGTNDFKQWLSEYLEIIDQRSG
ncbi:MAG: hypothetical protein WC534_03040 [Candidatus Paceibacterota bacterium]